MLEIASWQWNVARQAALQPGPPSGAYSAPPSSSHMTLHAASPWSLMQEHTATNAFRYQAAVLTMVHSQVASGREKQCPCASLRLHPSPQDAETQKTHSRSRAHRGVTMCRNKYMTNQATPHQWLQTSALLQLS